MEKLQKASQVLEAEATRLKEDFHKDRVKKKERRWACGDLF